ncbi:MAG: hypothetical protein AAGJ08_07690 [Cyanobacteria bacterium P01_H01_bin.35]
MLLKFQVVDLSKLSGHIEQVISPAALGIFCTINVAIIVAIASLTLN